VGLEPLANDPVVLHSCRETAQQFAESSSVGHGANLLRSSPAGMQDDRVVRQWLEAPHIPIVHTLIERPTAILELTAFATRHANEGRVDNVLMTILPRRTLSLRLHAYIFERVFLLS